MDSSRSVNRYEDEEKIIIAIGREIGCLRRLNRLREIKIKIDIKTRPGNTISLVARPSDTIRDLKLKIPPSEWNHGEMPDLVYNGVYLNDNRTLRSYNIFWFSTLECRSGPKISITTMSGETISLEVASSNTTIGNLKAQVQDKVGVPQFQQRLFFDGRHLDNNCIIADYKIMDGSTLLLMRRSKGWIPIYVKTHDGKTISLQVKISDTIGDFKFKLKEVGGIDPFKQVLFFTGEQLLNNNCTLNDYNIHHVSLSPFSMAASAADSYHRLRDISVAADDSFHPHHPLRVTLRKTYSKRNVKQGLHPTPNKIQLESSLIHMPLEKLV